MIEKQEVIDYIKWLIDNIEEDRREYYPKWMHKQPLLSVIGYIVTHGETVAPKE